MRRSYYNYGRRYRRYSKPIKYSSETTATGFDLAPKADAISFYKVVMIPPVDAQGMRKVKNMKLTITNGSPSKQNVLFALVYVPQGTNASELNQGAGTAITSLYEPNQNVIMQGIVSGTLGFIERSTRLARNLNSGDSIALVVQATATVAEKCPVNVTLNYAISY